MDRHPPIDRHAGQRETEKVRQRSQNTIEPAVQGIGRNGGALSLPLKNSTESPILPAPANTSSESRSGRSIVTAKLAHLIRHPLAMIGVVWLLSMGIGSIAAVSIFKIDPNIPAITDQSDHQAQRPVADTALPSSPESVDQPNNTAVASEQQVPMAEPTHEPKKETLPLFSLGVVALGCAVGCLLLSRHFHAPPAKQQSRFPSRSRLPRAVPRPSRSRLSAQEQPISAETIPPEHTPEYSDSEPSASAPVAIVPANENHPLDWDEPSLADDLDIRQQRPVSHWL